MFCRNCGYQNPKYARRCIECGADLQKSSDQPIDGTPKRRRTIASCLINMISYSLIVAIVLAVIAAYTCLIEIPQPPTSGYPTFFLNIWAKLTMIQKSRCSISDSVGIPLTGLPTTEVDEASFEEPMCTNPSIIFDPEKGEIGTEFNIILQGFQPSEKIEACWYFPDGSLINCADLDTDSNGSKITKFWSESEDPVGTYLMEAAGECSSASIEFEIKPIAENEADQ